MKKLLAMLVCLVMSLGMMADSKPTITTYTYQGMYLMGMSDNGQWGLIYGSEECVNSPMIVNLKTKEVTALQTEAEVQTIGVCTAKDVSDDGNIVVGSYKGHPAYLNRSTGKWAELDTKAGEFRAVTPDGKYAVGSTNNGGDANGEISWYTEEWGIMYDLTTNQEVKFGNFTIAKQDPRGYDIPYTRFIAVSPDGRFVLVHVLVDAEYFGYVIDRTKSGTEAITYLGYKTTNGGITYEPVVDNLHFCEPMAMSPNGKWVCGDAYIVEKTSAGYFNEYGATLRYNIETGETECYKKTNDDQTMLAGCIDNEGNIFAGTPQGSPVREFYVRNGDYWYALRSILQQQYGMDYFTATGYDNTGTPLGISADGKTIVSMVDPQFGQNFCLQMQESIIDVCKGLNLLGVYTMTPVTGSVFSKLREIRVTFDRDVEVVGEQDAASFGEWSSLSNNGIYVDPTDSKTVVVVFRSRTLADGQEYEFTIPRGTIAVKGDKTRVNEDIKTVFRGRANVPMAPVTVYPADGSVLSKLDNTSSPVLLTFPTTVKVSDEATAGLYTDAGQKVCALTVAYNGNSIALYPATTQYLYLGTDYKVVLDAGAITDVSGDGGNEALTVHYTGNYERTVSTDDAVLFADDFNDMSSSLATWMLFEGDYNTPQEEVMEMFEFDAQNTPWNFSIRDNNASTDYCAASHSMYEPMGQSEDWMVTPQIYIPDGSCTLSFDAQNYGAEDRLKVLVWENGKVLSAIVEEDAEDMIANGKVVFDELLSPGASEEGIDGEWTHYTVDLSAFAGKSVYICFGNQNNAQSMVFVDNVKVERNMMFLLSLNNKQRVVGETSAVISGKIIANSDDTYSSIGIVLLDGKGNKIDELGESGLSLKKGDAYAFSFAKPLPLTVGEVNKFSIEVKLGDVATTATSSIASLAFEPVKRVVLEEMTGTTCGNCPLGIIAIEKMEQVFGEQFIPVGIHTYDGDAWGTGLQSYSAELGLIGAPTGIVNRNGKISNPMESDPILDEFTYTNGDDLWYDLVAAELDEPANLDVSARLSYKQGDDKFGITATVRSAVNAQNQNLNVFMVLMEDKLVGIQENYYSSRSDAVLGDWGFGGKYGKGKVPGVVYNDVVRLAYGFSMTGTGGLLPQALEAGQQYTTESMTCDLPGTLSDVKNAKVAVIIIDANTDRIVNACVVKFSEAGTAIVDVNADAFGQKTYNLQGVEVDSSYKGIVIRNGKKIMQ